MIEVVEESIVVNTNVSSAKDLSDHEVRDSSMNTSGSTSSASSSANTSTASSSSGSSSLTSASSRSSLQSPREVNTVEAAEVIGTQSTSEPTVFGIATRTPGGPTVTKSCWDKVTGVDLILGSPPTLTPSPAKPPETSRKSARDWDADLRELVTKQSRLSLLQSAAEVCDEIVQQKKNQQSVKCKKQTVNKKKTVQKPASPEVVSSGDDFESPKQKKRSKVPTAESSSSEANKSKSSKKPKASSNKKSTLKTVTNEQSTALSPVHDKDSEPCVGGESEQEQITLTSAPDTEQATLVDVETASTAASLETSCANQGITLLVSTDDVSSSAKKIVIQSPRTVSKHLVTRNKIQVVSSNNSPKRAIDMNLLLAAVSQPSCLMTPKKIDEPTTSNPHEETPLTKLLRDQPVHELTVIDTPVFPVTPNCDLLNSQCASPPSPNESPYYPPPRDTYDLQFEADTLGIEIQQEKQNKTTSEQARELQSTSEEIQSARTSRSKSKKDKPNASDGSSKKKSQAAETQQSFSIAQLLAAEQSRIGLTKSNKKPSKTTPEKDTEETLPIRASRSRTRKAKLNISDVSSASDTSTKKTSHTAESKRSSRASSKRSPLKQSEEVACYQVTQSSTLEERLPIYSPSLPPDEQVDVHDYEDDILQQQKEVQFQDLLEEKKQRLKQILRRDFSKKEMPVVHLRVGGTKSTRVANKGKAPAAKQSVPPPKKSPAKKQKQPSKSQSVTLNNTEKQKTVSQKKPAQQVEGEVTAISPRSSSLLQERLSMTPPQIEVNQLLENNTSSVQSEAANIETTLSNEIQDNRLSSPLQITPLPATEVQKLIQLSPAKLKAQSVSPRKSFSVDEIANRLRCAAGLSDDEDMPPLVLHDSPVKLKKTTVQPVATPQKLQNILQQLELSPVSKPRTESSNEQHKQSRHTAESTVTDQQSSTTVSPNLTAIEQQPNTLPVPELVTEQPTSEVKTAVEREASQHQLPSVPVDNQVMACQDKSQQDKTVVATEANPCTPAISLPQVSKNISKPVKRVGCYSMLHDENVKYPEFIPETDVNKKLSIKMLVDEEDGEGVKTKIVTLSYTPTYELLLMKPYKHSSERHSTSHRRSEHRSSSRPHYSRYGDKGISKHPSRSDRRSRSHSPNGQTSKQSYSEKDKSRRLSDSSRSRRSRSSSGSRRSSRNRHSRSRRSRSRQRSREHYDRRDDRYVRARENRNKQQSEERVKQDKRHNAKSHSSVESDRRDRRDEANKAKTQNNKNEGLDSARDVGVQNETDASHRRLQSTTQPPLATTQGTTPSQQCSENQPNETGGQDINQQSEAHDGGRSPCFSPEKSPTRSSSSSMTSSEEEEQSGTIVFLLLLLSFLQ